MMCFLDLSSPMGWFINQFSIVPLAVDSVRRVYYKITTALVSWLINFSDTSTLQDHDSSVEMAHEIFRLAHDLLENAQCCHQRSLPPAHTCHPESLLSADINLPATSTAFQQHAPVTRSIEPTSVGNIKLHLNNNAIPAGLCRQGPPRSHTSEMSPLSMGLFTFALP